jgi:hypothetical protein
LRIEKPLVVTTTRVFRADGFGDSPPPTRCEVKVLHHKPAGKSREVGTLEVTGARAQHENMVSLLKRKACEAGANAVLIKTIARKRIEGVKVDHIEAVALIVGTPKPPVDPSPVPKSITVTPEGPAVPKTITVDPDVSP